MSVATHEPEAQEPRTDEAGRRSPWAVAAVVAVAVSVVVRVYVAWSARWPSFPYDEVLMLQMSRMFAGLDVPDPIGGAGYFPGWAVLLTPLWWVTEDPLAVYRLGIALGVAVSIVTVWPFALVLRRWGLTTAQAVLAASIVLTLPARALQADWVLSEQLLFLTIVVLLLAVMRLWERPTVLRALVLGAAAFAVLFTHARMLPALLALMIWLVLFLRRRWPVALVGLVAVAAAIYGANELGRHLNEVLLGREFTQGDRFWDQIGAMYPGLLVRTLGGQAWTQLLSSFGVIALGVVAVVTAVWKDLRRFRFGPTTFVLGGTLAVFLASALNWANDQLLFFNEWVRLDWWLYGRYVDPFAALVVGAGIALIIRGASRAQHLVSLVAVVLGSVPVLLLVAPGAPTFGYVTPAHVPGIMPWAWLLPTEPWAFPYGPQIIPTLTNENRFWLIATISVVVVLVVLAVLRRRRLAAAGVLLVLAAAGTVVSNAGADRFQDQNGAIPAAMLSTLDDLRAADEDLDVVLIRDCPSPDRDVFGFRNYLFYWELPDTVTSVPSGTAPPDADIAISCVEWTQGLESGALALPETRRGTEVVWLLTEEALAAADEAGVVG